MSNRKALLFFLLTGLLFGSSYGWLEYEQQSKKGRLFLSLDTAKIRTISFLHPKDSCYLLRKPSGWAMANGVDADPFVTETVLQILYHSQSRRLLEGKEARLIGEELQSLGCQVEVRKESEETYVFRIWGNVKQGRSYVQLNEKIHEIFIPGQVGYLAALFFLNKTQWRSRRLFYSDAHSLESLVLRYPQTPEHSFHIRIENYQPQIEGLNTLDTTSVYEYLSLYELFYTNEYIQKGQVAAYDSLLLQSPLAYLKIHDLYSEASKAITIYTRKGDPYFLLQESDSLYSLCKRDRFFPFLKKKIYFSKK